MLCSTAEVRLMTAALTTNGYTQQYARKQHGLHLSMLRVFRSGCDVSGWPRVRFGRPRYLAAIASVARCAAARGFLNNRFVFDIRSSFMNGRASIQAIADAAGVDHHTARRAIALAQLKHGRGGFDLSDALQAIADHADPARIAGHASVGRGEGAGAATSTLAEARARAEQARADKLELEVQIRRGALVERDAVTATAVDLTARVRTAMLSIGFRLAPKLNGLTDDASIARAINEEIRATLRELADADHFASEVLS